MNDVVPDNIRALGPIYFASMLDQMRAFTVADRLVELFETGMLPIDHHQGRSLVKARKEAAATFSESERHALYDRAFGIGGDAAGPASNREFESLWLRFMSAIVELLRQQEVGAPDDTAIAADGVQKAGRDLARNLSKHGGSLRAAALKTVKQIDTVIQLLNDEDVRAAFDARTTWQVIEKVSADLGGARNVNVYRVLATSGRTIIEHLANDAAAATDADLVAACEAWIAATAMV
jgi:hypothetical protein